MMRHIDHHTLELLFLGSATVAARRRGLERHLAGCPDCKNAMGEIEEIYRTAGEHLRAKQAASREGGLAIARRAESLLEARHAGGAALFAPRKGAVGRFIAFARRHPVGVVSASFATVALSGFALGFLLRGFPKESNPAGYHYEPARQMFCIQNGEGAVLWERTVWNLENWDHTETLRRIRFTGVADLDGDGRNEVVTSLPLLPHDGLPTACILRIFNADGEIRSESTLGHTVRFSGRGEYPGNYFGNGGLAIFGGEREKEIIASVPGFRSPTLLARLNRDGRVLGEYWHYGHLAGIYGVRPGGVEAERLIVTGINDIDDESGSRSVVIALLDPFKIADTTEASASRGFGYAPSAAEEVYLRIPDTDIAIALEKQPVVTRLSSADTSGYRFIVATSLEEPLGGFEYVFSRDFHVRDVLPLDGIEAIHARLLREGKLRSRLDRGYLGGLARSVEYWDGHAWRREYCRVKIQQGAPDARKNKE